MTRINCGHIFNYRWNIVMLYRKRACSWQCLFRNCIGQHFAMNEEKIMLARIFHRYLRNLTFFFLNTRVFIGISKNLKLFSELILKLALVDTLFFWPYCLSANVSTGYCFAFQVYVRGRHKTQSGTKVCPRDEVYWRTVGVR